MIKPLEELEACLGPTPKVADLKVLHALDPHAERWLAASPLSFVGFSHPDGVSARG